MSDQIIDEQRRREQGGQSISDALEGVVGNCESGAGGTAGGRATSMWFRVNGDIERTHTAGVFLAEPKRGAQLPTLVVYVDSRARVTDFSANREVYLARMQAAGVALEDIRFRLSKYPSHKRTGSGSTGNTKPSRLPELTDAECKEIFEQTSDLPERLRESVQRAMENSIRAEKLN